MNLDVVKDAMGARLGRGRRKTTMALAVVGGLALGACAEADADESGIPTWDEFRRSAFQEPQTGVYVVDGDVALRDLDALEAYYWNARADVEDSDEVGFRLAINLADNGKRDAWGLDRRRALSYCVSRTLWGGRYGEIVGVMARAAERWNRSTNIQFVHDVTQDGSCDELNPHVVFDVRPTTDVPYVARAFFPHESRQERNVLINTDYDFPLPAPLENVTLVGVLRHELGHTLGFRHEHIRQGEFNGCIEDEPWEALTAYDSQSVMHYPHCEGTNTMDLDLTALDIEGARQIYDGARLRWVVSDRGGNRCLDSGGGAPGAHAGLGNCGPASTDWAWDYLWADTFDYDVRLRSQGHCLTVADPSAGAVLPMQDCDASAAQRWHHVGTDTGRFQLESMAAPGLCIALGESSEDMRVRLQPCASGGPSTRFHSPLRPF